MPHIRCVPQTESPNCDASTAPARTPLAAPGVEAAVTRVLEHIQRERPGGPLDLAFDTGN